MDFYDTYFSLQLDLFHLMIFIFSFKTIFYWHHKYIPVYVKMAYTDPLELFVPGFIDGLLLQ